MREREGEGERERESEKEKRESKNSHICKLHTSRHLHTHTHTNLPASLLGEQSCQSGPPALVEPRLSEAHCGPRPSRTLPCGSTSAGTCTCPWIVGS